MALVDVMLNQHRDLATAKAFFRSAQAVTGLRPSHDACLQAIRAELGKRVRHWTNRFLNNRLE
jgi:putative transposase